MTELYTVKILDQNLKISGYGLIDRPLCQWKFLYYFSCELSFFFLSLFFYIQKSPAKQIGHSLKKSFRCVPSKTNHKIPTFSDVPEKKIDLTNIVWVLYLFCLLVCFFFLFSNRSFFIVFYNNILFIDTLTLLSKSYIPAINTNIIFSSHTYLNCYPSFLIFFSVP